MRNLFYAVFFAFSSRLQLPRNILSSGSIIVFQTFSLPLFPNLSRLSKINDISYKTMRIYVSAMCTIALTPLKGFRTGGDCQTILISKQMLSYLELMSYSMREHGHQLHVDADEIVCMDCYGSFGRPRMRSNVLAVLTSRVGAITR